MSVIEFPTDGARAAKRNAAIADCYNGLDSFEELRYAVAVLMAVLIAENPRELFEHAFERIEKLEANG
jgi:hypothetical protein